MTTADSSLFSAVGPMARGGKQGISVGMVSTFPPTSCGLATFASALSRGLLTAGASDVRVIRVLQPGDLITPGEEPCQWVPGNIEGLAKVADCLNDHDLAIVQHEYGIFGDNDGEAVVDLLAAVNRPVITTLHTVPSRPSTRQRKVLETVIERSRASVVMTEVARHRLLAHYDVDPDVIHNIPHGATRPPAVAHAGHARNYVLTWGLLGPGKGIEWVVDALATAPLADFDIEYRVVGRTHPKVADRDGDSYLDMLRRRADDRGVGHRVSFDTRYHSLDRLLDIVSAAAVVVLPYESVDQITSGVLVDAVTAGVPVVATRFPHARELLSDGAGIVVPFGDAIALAEAIQRVLSDDVARVAMRQRASELALSHDWVSVAAAYLDLATACGAGAVDVVTAERHR